MAIQTKARCKRCCNEPRGAIWTIHSVTEDRPNGLLVRDVRRCNNCGNERKLNERLYLDEELWDGKLYKPRKVAP